MRKPTSKGGVGGRRQGAYSVSRTCKCGFIPVCTRYAVMCRLCVPRVCVSSLYSSLVFSWSIGRFREDALCRTRPVQLGERRTSSSPLPETLARETIEYSRRLSQFFEPCAELDDAPCEDYYIYHQALPLIQVA